MVYETGFSWVLQFRMMRIPYNLFKLYYIMVDQKLPFEQSHSNSRHYQLNKTNDYGQGINPLPKAITRADSSELVAYNTGKCGSQNTSRQGSLTHASGEQINVINMSVNTSQYVYQVRRHFSRKVAKVPSSGHVAELPVEVVPPDSVITSWWWKNNVINKSQGFYNRSIQRLLCLITLFLFGNLTKKLHDSLINQ